MAVFFFDSSAIVKRYVAETGSAYVDSLADLKSRNSIYLAGITRVEVASAFARRIRAAGDARTALTLFQHDLTNTYFIIDITFHLLSEAMRLATQYALRGYDAVQLAAALTANGMALSSGLPPITLVSADAELNDAAQAESLNVEDPNNYP